MTSRDSPERLLSNDPDLRETLRDIIDTLGKKTSTQQDLTTHAITIIRFYSDSESQCIASIIYDSRDRDDVEDLELKGTNFSGMSLPGVALEEFVRDYCGQLELWDVSYENEKIELDKTSGRKIAYIQRYSNLDEIKIQRLGEVMDYLQEKYT